jgi:hypothetical protein
MQPMKHIATVALMLNLGVASVYAQQRAVKLTFSGTSGPSAASLGPGTATGEDSFAGSGTLGLFTYHDVTADITTPSPSASCSGATQIHFLRMVGAAVFRFADGGLLYVNLTQGDDCIDFAANHAICTMMFQITGGTGRFKNTTGILTLTETVVPVLTDASQNPVFFASTGTITGVVSGVGAEVAQPDAQQ